MMGVTGLSSIVRRCWIKIRKIFRHPTSITRILRILETNAGHCKFIVMAKEMFQNAGYSVRLEILYPKKTTPYPGRDEVDYKDELIPGPFKTNNDKMLEVSSF